MLRAAWVLVEKIGCLFYESVGTHRIIAPSPCEFYRLPSCDLGRRVREGNNLALRNSCDNEGCAREKSSAKHCDC